MTYESTTGQPSTAQTARDEAAGVAHGAADASKSLAHEGKEQAKQVAGEAGRQAKDLLGAARGELSQQASSQQQRLAGGLRTFGDELSSMADSSTQPGLASDIARQVASRTDAIAGWLEDREPGSLVTELAEYGRRNPATFLALAVGAGVLAGRLTRGLKDASSTDEASVRSTGVHRAPGAPSTVAPVTTTVPAWPPVDVVEPGAGYEHSVGGGTPVTHTPATTPLGTTSGGTALGDPVAGVELPGEPGFEPRREEGWR